MQIILIKQKKTFPLLLLGSDDNKRRLSFQFIYENVLPFFLSLFSPSHSLDTFSIKQKDVLLLFSIVFLLVKREKSKKKLQQWTMWYFFYWKFSFVMFFHRLQRSAKLSQSRSWSEKFLKNNKLWLFSVNLISLR